jgi:acetyl esterase/lipase
MAGRASRSPSGARHRLRRLRVTLVALLLLAVSAPAAGARVNVRHDVRYGADAGEPLLADVYRPAAGQQRRMAVITVHGGQWLYNDKAVFAPIAADLARRSGFVVVNIEYPRAPAGAALQARQRRAVEESVRWVRAHASTLGIDPRRVGALGGSAGGNLVGLLATDGSGPLRGGVRLPAAVTWSGQVDLEHLSGAGATNVTNYLGCDLATCPQTWALASPIDHVSRGDTPMLLFGSRGDSTPPTQATAMARALHDAHVEAKAVVLRGARHGQQYAADAMARTIAFLKTHLARG